MKIIIDVAFAKKNLKVLNTMILLLLVIQFLSLVLSFVTSYLFEVFSQTALTQLKKDLIYRLLRLPLSYFDASQTGYLLSRVGEVDGLSVFLSSTLVRVLVGFFEFVFCLTILIHLNWKLTFLSLSILPFLAWATRRYSRGIRKLSREVMEKGAILSHQVEDALSGVEVVKFFAAEKREAARIHDFLDDFRLASIRKTITLAYSSGLLALIGAVGGFLILWYSGVNIIQGSFTIGSYIAFAGYLAKLYGPTQTLAFIGLSIQPGLTALERVRELLEADEEKPGGLEMERLRGDIEFKNVSFGYDSKSALRNINLKIEPGEKVLITGPNGSGKSTLAKLILGLYNPQEGEILIDGQRSESISLSSLRERISIVSQNTFLFNDTIRNNIAFSKPNAKAEEIQEAAELSGTAEFVKRLAGGYETIVGETGKRLSGGERQKIAVARAVLKDADIIIFDEAGTHLDRKSKEKLAHLLNGRFKDKTCLLISHHRDFEQIMGGTIVLDKGGIVNQTHG
ncbi:MAG: ABC transporter ATP-binding protein/permease [Candidatus Aminicenantes bacterium]|nr:ABC transporter ATP-binding protein/permease [Candidatus Aminicenantes bacterium]